MLPVGLIARLDEAVRATGRSKADLARTAIDRYLQDLEL
jgi:predicted DNA-binding protein